MTTKYKNLFSLLFLTLLSFGIFHVAAAATDTGIASLTNIGLGSGDPRVMIVNIIRIAFGFLGLIAVSMIIYAGFLWMTSHGEAEKATSAKNILKAAVIGLVIILSAVAITTFIINALLGATGSDQGTNTSQSDSFGGRGGGGNINGRVSCDGNPITSACEVDSNKCQIDEYCADDCTCAKRGGQGDTCDSNPATKVCEPNNSACGEYLNCDNNSCLCVGGPVIKSASPSSGFCENNKNKPCSSDADCGVGDTCNKNIPNAAPGNFITIQGIYFGTSTGNVYFSNNGNWIQAKLADDAAQGNPICGAAVWRDDQIIAILPAGLASSSAIKVVAANNQTDATDDNRGPRFGVTINAIDRPGLCKIDPASGQLGNNLNYYGVKLASGKAFFGDLFNRVEAPGSIFNNNTQGQAKVPNIQAGEVTTFVLKNNVASNFLAFSKTEEANTAPSIISFDPVQGAVGQYVTIRGTKLGQTQGQSKVYFGDKKNEASYDFPAICADSIWNNNQVIVKVPAGLANGNYKIIIDLAGYGKIDTGSSTPSEFNVNSNIALSPSVCKIDPTMAPISSEVNLWGEYFGAKTNLSKVRFQLNRDQFGTDISYWDKDGTSSTGIKPDKATTVIPSSASTGPVRTVRDNLVSNGINLTVGSCSTNSQCGSGVCCDAASYKKGQCVTNTDECSAGVSACVYQWGFSTGSEISCRSSEKSCGLICCANKTGGCQDATQNLCVGCSAGQNSCDDGSCCNTACAGNPGATYCANNTASCAGYSANECTEKLFCPNVPGQCSPRATGTKKLGACDFSCNNEPACNLNLCSYNAQFNQCVKLNSTCDLPRAVKDIFNKDTNASCATYQNQNRWQISVTASCPDGWTGIGDGKCVEDNTVCNLCSSGFECLNNNGAGVCALDKKTCPDTAACSADNKCVANDPGTCECCCRIEKSNADCCTPLKCGGTCGTDITNDDAGFGMCTGCASVGTTVSEHDAACNCSKHSGQYCDLTVAGGACRDCASLDPNECSNHASACCVDGEKGNVCRSGSGNKNIITSDTPNLAYCPYYQCSALNPSQCDATNPIASSTNGVYNSTLLCGQKCSSGAGAGLSCVQKTTNGCDTSICSLACLDNNGGASSANSCGTCCCVPGTLNEASLSCLPDKSPCSGGARGLFCGCTVNDECGNTASVGCGNDTCCHAKPSVDTTEPINNANGICRNALLSATFNQQMNLQSFTGNMMVVGDYGTNPCPDNTVYLSSTSPTRLNIVKNWIKNKLSFIPWFDKIFYSRAEATGGNFCAVKGLVSGFNQADGKTQITFAPVQSLDGNRKYYVIIKGNDPKNKTAQGITNNYGLSFSGPHQGFFNAINFNYSYIWSFTTKPALSSNSGLCLVDHTAISPTSYLFSTNQNDLNEKDYEDDVVDSDKIFLAQAISADNQTLAPVSDYYWTWNWTSEKPEAADFIAVSALGDDKKLVRAKENVTDDKTVITAEARTQDKKFAASAPVWIFVCANPWPPIKTDGTWTPWQDRDSNCASGTGACYNNNFEFYYCRDRGDAGTADDLPAILSDKTIIRGASSDLLKEYFFLREGIPNTLTLATTTNDTIKQGGRAGLYWNIITPPAGQTLRDYQIYYGSSSRSYSKTLSTATRGVEIAPFIADGLDNGKTYYFTVTAQYSSGAESKYSNEVLFIPRDTVSPAIPANLTATPAAGQVNLKWTANTDDTANYKIYYGAQKGVPAVLKNIGKVTEYLITNLTNGANNYFSVSAIDAYGNESARSAEVMAAAQ